jgi:S-adenosylmethionine-dependent methyltransferase
MTDESNAFSRRLDQWKAEQRTPWAQLKYDLVAAHLRDALPAPPLHILDAGGGNGVESLPLAQAGYAVTLLDSSAAMLADAAQQIAATDLAAQVQLREGDLHQLTTLFPTAQFDAILCHNVIQYSADLPALLGQLHAVLRPGGLLSLVSINRFSVPYQAAFLHRDLDRALASLDDHQQLTTIFGIPMTMYVADEVTELLSAQGFRVGQHYGVRCLCDYWGDTALKMQPAVMAKLARLDAALADRAPYKHLARYFQLIAWKT